MFDVAVGDTGGWKGTPMDGVGNKVEQWLGQSSVTSYLDAHPHLLLFCITVIVAMLVAALTAIFVVQMSERLARRRIARAITEMEQQVAARTTVPGATFHGCATAPKPDDQAPYPRFADEADEPVYPALVDKDAK